MKKELKKKKRKSRRLKKRSDTCNGEDLSNLPRIELASATATNVSPVLRMNTPLFTSKLTQLVLNEGNS